MVERQGIYSPLSLLPTSFLLFWWLIAPLGSTHVYVAQDKKGTQTIAIIFSVTQTQLRASNATKLIRLGGAIRISSWLHRPRN